MFQLVISFPVWPVKPEFDEFTLAQSADMAELKAIATDDTFRQWARLQGAAFSEVWQDSSLLEMIPLRK